MRGATFVTQYANSTSCVWLRSNKYRYIIIISYYIFSFFNSVIILSTSVNKFVIKIINLNDKWKKKIKN